jgi:DNA-directed RNA polymerase subunit RPC12/RpoP
MVVVAQALEELNIDVDKDDLEMVQPSEGNILTSETPGREEVVCGRCDETIAKDFDWESISNTYTECPACGATLLLGGLK